MKRIINFLKFLKRLPALIEQTESNNNQRLNYINHNVGKLLAHNNMLRKNEIINNINLAEFKIYSQWGDDGIIQFLIEYLNIKEKTFIEFGVESYEECNTRYLLINNNWSGFIMDGSKSHIEKVKNDSIYWKYNLTALDVFITRENINELITKNKFSGEIGLLSVDIDGNDYWVWESIHVVSPIIVIAEYNSVFGATNSWTTPYKEDYYRTKEHYSNIYYGSSLLSLFDLAQKKGYSFIGCNSNGNNAYFVRNDKLSGLKPLSVEEGFVNAQFSESRDVNGNLLYLRGDDRINLLKGKPVYNTRKNIIEYI